MEEQYIEESAVKCDQIVSELSTVTYNYHTQFDSSSL